MFLKINKSALQLKNHLMMHWENASDCLEHALNEIENTFISPDLTQ